MIKFTESKWAIIFIVLVIILETISIMILIKRKDVNSLFWAIPVFFATSITGIAVSQQEILIDDNKITMKMGLPFLYKPKTMVWDNVDIVGKDSVLGIVIYRLATRCPVKPKAINISGIKNMDSLIVEIVKRARFASIDPKILKLVEKYNEKKG